MIARPTSPHLGAVSRPPIVRSLTSLTAIVLLSACGSLELDYNRPEGFDLTGTWHLIEDASGTPPSQRRLRSRGGMLAFVTSDFPVLHAREMRIEQSRDSMGIRYDTGDYRDVSWGSRRRGLWEVRAGWHEGALYILWDAVDAEAIEVFTLSDGGRRLDVRVHIESGGNDIEVVRAFRR